MLNAARATDATTTSRSVKATTKPILVSGLENTMMSITVYKTISPSLITRKKQNKPKQVLRSTILSSTIVLVFFDNARIGRF